MAEHQPDPHDSNARDDRADEDGRPQPGPNPKERGSEGRDVPPSRAERGPESPWMGGG